MKRLNIQIQQRSTVPPELCGLKKPRHSLCCNGHTRQRFASALCGGRVSGHGKPLAAPGAPGRLSLHRVGEDPVCPHRRFTQDETIVIVARPVGKIKGRKFKNYRKLLRSFTFFHKKQSGFIILIENDRLLCYTNLD